MAREAARIAGRTNSSNVTKLDTGLPGSPNSSTGSGRPLDVAAPERERLAGLDGDPPQVDVPDRVERGPDDVVRPDRDAARHDDDVGASASAASEARLDVLEPVGRDPEVERLRAGRRGRAPAARGRSRRGCRRGRGRSPGGPHLVAGREHRDDRGGGGRTSCATPAPAASATAAGVTRDAGARAIAVSVHDVAARGAGWRCPAPTAAWTRHAAGSGPAASRPRGPATRRASSGVVCSTGTTASAPGGIGAPVAIRIAVPARTARVAAPPARAPRRRPSSRTGAPSAAPATSAARIA